MIHLHGHDLLYALQKTAIPNDLVIIISLSGEFEGVVELASILRTSHIPTVSITGLRGFELMQLLL